MNHNAACLASADLRSGGMSRLPCEHWIDGVLQPVSRSGGGSSAWLSDYYAGIADTLIGQSILHLPDHLCWPLHEPVGATAPIKPGNDPTSAFARGVAPAPAALCSVVAKSVDTTGFSALLIGRLLLALQIVEDDAAALAAPNGADYWLVAGLLTRDIARLAARARRQRRTADNQRLLGRRDFSPLRRQGHPGGAARRAARKSRPLIKTVTGKLQAASPALGSSATGEGIWISVC